MFAHAVKKSKLGWEVDDLKVLEKRFSKVDKGDGDKFKCDCSSAWEDRIHIMGECLLCENEREIYIVQSELGKMEGCDRDAFESCDCEKKAIAVLGDRNWSQQLRVEVTKVDERLSAIFFNDGKSDWPSEFALLGTKPRPCEDAW